MIPDPMGCVSDFCQRTHSVALLHLRHYNIFNHMFRQGKVQSKVAHSAIKFIFYFSGSISRMYTFVFIYL